MGQRVRAAAPTRNAFERTDGRFSPNGRLVAFTSDESGREEVYVAGYRADGALGPATMASSRGGARPAWASDGRRLFYYSDPNTVMWTFTFAR